MRRVMLVLLVVIFVIMGCVSVRESEECIAPNWTSDGRIIFVRDYNYVRERHIFTDESNLEGSYEVLTLCEVGVDGRGYREIKEVSRSERYAYSIGINGVSSSGEWVVFDLREEGDKYHRICVMRRDGSVFYNTGVIGMHPDFSPDASKIVYEKPDSGIWVMDRDGSNNHCIVSDPDAKYPAWSPDDSLIAYVISHTESLIVYNLNTFEKRIFVPNEGGWFEAPDWGPVDTNAIIASVNGRGWSEIIYLLSNEIVKDTVGWYAKWSPDGGKYICYGEKGYYVINRNGSNKWYLKDVTGGE